LDATSREKEKIVTVMLGINIMSTNNLRRINKILAKIKLNARQYSILYQITRTDRPPPRSQKELAERSAIRENRIVSVLHRMSKAGLLRREKTTDRRLNQVAITDKGRKQLDKAENDVRLYYDELLARISNNERQAMTCLLKNYK
jgi:DNA-binding MarR family transcriptional regulator